VADIEKVIRGLERCTKQTCPSILSKEYEECEYTDGLYCRQDKLLVDALALLKEQQEKILMMNMVYGSDCKVVGELVRCKDCKHRPKEVPYTTSYGETQTYLEFPNDSKCPCWNTSDEYYSWNPDDNWFCADGEMKE